MRKFLYFIVAMILLALAILFALRLYGDELTRIALVPSAEFEEQEALAVSAYEDPAMWFSRPGMNAASDPARWQPPLRTPSDPATTAGTGEAGGEAPDAAPAAQTGTRSPADGIPAGGTGIANGATGPSSGAASAPPPEALGNAGEDDDGGGDNADSSQPPRFAVFFVHPTSYLDRSRWNAPLDHPESQERAQIFVRGLASAFNQASEIWAPRYRQATFGAYLSDSPAAAQALDAAYRDVSQAFDFFLESIAPDMPIVLAGHSQGSHHITRLLAERIAGTPLQERVAMAYPIGWPISMVHDLPALGLPACAAPEQGGCIASWSSFAEPADPGQLLDIYANSPGLDGSERAQTPILCVNPISGILGGSAPASANLGTLVPDDALTTGELVPGAVGARCDERGLLLIGDGPQLGPYVLPGNNYHVYDIPLFWANLQADVARRVRAWEGAQP